MSEIPEDIMRAADEMAADWGSDERGSFWAFGIAQSVLDERNRCLSIIAAIEPHNPSEAHLLETIARRVRGQE